MTKKLCVAPGHPACRIECPKGCMALFHEPNGPCRTRCSGSAAPLDLPENGVFSICVKEFPLGELLDLMGYKGARPQQVDLTCSLSLQEITSQQVVAAVAHLL